MDLLKSQFDRIQQQLAGLSASQKMLSACLVVIIVMTVAMWGRYAAVPEMEPLGGEALSPDELRAVKRQLRASDIPFRIVDGRVEVPSERWTEAAADLTFSQAVPNAKIDFQALVKGMNPLAPHSTTEAQFNNFNELRLAEVIAKFPGVESAQVFVDKTEKVRIGGGIKPAATVSIAMKRGEKASQRLVDAAAHFIAGSHAGLSWQRVSVVVDGMLQRVRDNNAGLGGGGSEHLDLVERYEKAVESKVLGYFRNIPQMSVSVSFVVNAETKHTRSHSYDDDNLILKPVEENEKTLESNTPLAPGAGEPGAQPNIGMSVVGGGAAASGGQATVTESDVKTKSQLLVGDEVTEIVTPAGIGTPVAAAVQIPRSYIADVIKHERGAAIANAGEPDAQAIQTRFNQEMLQIRGMVRRLVGLKKEDEEAVLVSMYTDMLPAAAIGAPAGGAAAQGFSVTAVAGAHSREILLGGLAVVSLFMVSMMVRKGSPLPVAATLAMPTMAMPVLDASESLAGEVSEGKSMLDAMELDDDAVRAQQMLDQVSSMVEENPDAAAGLVKRWLNRS